MTDSHLLERTCDSLARYVALGNESFEAHGATFVSNRNTPRRYDANHVSLIRSSDPSDLDALFRRADLEYAGLPYRRFVVDGLSPPQVEARLQIEQEFSVGAEGVHLLLEGDLSVLPKQHDIREILDDGGWDAYAHLLDMDHIEDARKHGRIADLSLTPEWVAYLQAKSPTVRFWLAYVDDMPVGFFNSWPGENGIGQVEDLFTHPDFRHQGIATALMAHCVADARARGAGPVAITADAGDTPKHMYAALGFRPLYVSRNYIKKLDS